MSKAKAKVKIITEVDDPDSLDGKASLVRAAWREEFGDEHDSGWVIEVYEDRAIVQIGDEFFAYPYTMDEEEGTEFGERSEVKPQVGYIAASVQAPTAIAGEAIGDDRWLHAGGTIKPKADKILETVDGRILENLDDGVGSKWRVTMIQPGTSKNGRRYLPKVLAEAAPLYEGVQSFDGHRTEAERRASATRNLVGFHSEVEVADDGSLRSTFTISESAPHIRQLFLTAYKNDLPDLIGFSHDIRGVSAPAVEAGQRISDVTKIVGVNSVDTVADPAAGGRIERLVASSQKGAGVMAPTLEELQTIVDELDDDQRAALVKSLNGDGDGGDKPKDVTEATDGDGDGDAENLLEAGSLLQRVALREALEGIELPAEAVKALTDKVTADAFSEVQITDIVTETVGIWDAAMKALPGQLPGQGPAIEAGEEAVEKRQKALDGLIFGEAVDKVQPFRSLKQAYAAFSGKHPFGMGDEDFNRDLLAETVGAVARMGERITESLTAGSWSSALGDSITRRLIAEYQSPALQTWRQIVSSVVPITDFRTQRRDRIGGYDVLSVVNEGASYPALTSPTDEEATYAITKKGGVEDLTLEMIANDDVGGVRRIPINLGKAAALTLYRAIWIDIIVTNPAIYDGTVLFHSDHNNTTAVALAEAGISTLRNLMVTQTRLGEDSGFVGLLPKFVVTPPELFTTAFKLTQSGSSVAGGEAASNTQGAGPIPNPWQGLVPIEVPLFTDADDWYLIADPASVPTLEVGFYQGREDPEILIQDAPAVGSVFTADKVTYKVRHIWGLTVLDYRGFQKGTQ